MEQFQVGDVVEVVEVRDSDYFAGVKVGNQYVVKKAYLSEVTVYHDSYAKYGYDLWNYQLKLVKRGGKNE